MIFDYDLEYSEYARLNHTQFVYSSNCVKIKLKDTKLEVNSELDCLSCLKYASIKRRWADFM